MFPSVTIDEEREEWWVFFQEIPSFAFDRNFQNYNDIKAMDIDALNRGENDNHLDQVPKYPYQLVGCFHREIDSKLALGEFSWILTTNYQSPATDFDWREDCNYYGRVQGQVVLIT